MRSAALLEARRRGAEVFPVLRVAWVARELALGTGIYAPAGRLVDGGQVTAVTMQGGWGGIEYGSGLGSGQFDAVETKVKVVDVERTLLRLLEGYDPRGSAAAIDWAAAGLAAEDWEPIFRGIVSDWDRDGLATQLTVKTDDTVLRTPVPPKVFSRTEWGAAADTTIFGTALPLVLGVHDAFQVTGRGMVAGVNIRYDKDLGYWWIASMGNLVKIRRVYFDGVAQPATSWTTIRGVYGGNLMTIISFPEAYKPDKGAVVSFDCEGPDEDGLYAGASLANPVVQLRTVLEEYVYRTPPLGAWVGAHPIVDAESWDAAAVWFAVHGYESARRFGGNQNPESAAEVVSSFLEAHPWVRIHWTPLGTLAIVILDPDDVDPDDDLWFDLERYHESGTVEYTAGDRREVYTHVKVPYMWSSAEQKYVVAIEAHDVAALAEKVKLEIPNNWSQGRYLLDDEEGT
jgi:hypothetical protein